MTRAKSADEQAEELAWRIMLPSRVAQHLAPRVMGRPYIVHPWIAYVEREVMAMFQRPGREVLIINTPPQEGKSTYFGMWLPFWLVGMRPDDLGMLIGYSDDYMGTWGVRVRDLIATYGPELFNVGLSKSQGGINNWRTARGFGGILSAGIGGGITGNPGMWIVLDDVIKNMEEAGSPTTKRKHLEEWDGSISARFQEETKVIACVTLWAEDDLPSSIVLRSLEPDYEGIPVRQIRIKAMAEPDEDEELEMTEDDRAQWRDPIGRRIGETLQGQHSRSFFLEKRASISPYVWSALYQASPSARKGSMFPMENWGWYDPDDLPPLTTSRRGWDLAATEGGGDFTVGAHVGKHVRPDKMQKVYILDLRRFQRSTSGVRDEVMRCARADGMGVRILMEQELQGSGKSVVQGYADDLRGWDFEGVRPDKEKVSRYTNYSDLQQRGHVLLPRRKDGSTPDWVSAFIAEHKMQMPDGRGPRHDDQIDAVALCINDMYGSGPIEIVDPGAPNRHAADQIRDLAALHGVRMQPPIPDRLAKLLGRQI
jgi:predicted phage terminase large subunit-like protein